MSKSAYETVAGALNSTFYAMAAANEKVLDELFTKALAFDFHLPIDMRDDECDRKVISCYYVGEGYQLNKCIVQTTLKEETCQVSIGF